MVYKYGLKLWSINTGAYYSEAKRLYDMGLFDYIELYVLPNSLHLLPDWQRLEIPFIIHAPHSMHGFNLAKKDFEHSNIEIYNELRLFADSLNTHYIIFHGGTDGDIKETARQLASFKDSRALIENKPFIALPNKVSGKYCRGFNIDEIKFVMDNTGCGFCFDFGHAICAANSQNLDPYEYCRDFLQLNPSMFHLTDIDDITSELDSHPHLGKGQLDFSRIIAMIPNDSYVTFETVKNSKENLNDFIEDMKWIKNFK